MDTSDAAYAAKDTGYFKNERREMLAFVPAQARAILEIGCGNGAFGALVKQRQPCRYHAIELVASEAALARTVLDEVQAANIEQGPLPYPAQSFDCLVLNDVLEHLVDPWATLKRLATLLQPGGHIVISIPNVRFSEVVKNLVFRDRWEYAQEGVLDRTHLRFFTRNSLRELVEQAGAEVLRLEGINPIRYAWRLQMLNIALLGALSSMRYPQYGVTARLR